MKYKDILNKYIKLHEVFEENKIDIDDEIKIINKLIYYFAYKIYKQKNKK